MGILVGNIFEAVRRVSLWEGPSAPLASPARQSEQSRNYLKRIGAVPEGASPHCFRYAAYKDSMIPGCTAQS